MNIAGMVLGGAVVVLGLLEGKSCFLRASFLLLFTAGLEGWLASAAFLAWTALPNMATGTGAGLDARELECTMPA